MDELLINSIEGELIGFEATKLKYFLQFFLNFLYFQNQIKMKTITYIVTIRIVLLFLSAFSLSVTDKQKTSYVHNYKSMIKMLLEQ